ncbi:peptidoglycan-binding protein [Aquamicrobium terrae]|uniref:Localization factor PodJL n=1 Tax=Aquamicrobium terrae TaxID=1324945 RepID=A0ABV2MZA3_9HYPH
MSNRRSYLDTLNAGRPRKPNSTLEQINESLAALEERLQLGRTDQRPRPDSLMRGAEHGFAEERDWTARRGGFEQGARHSAPLHVSGYQAMARDMDRIRGQGDELAKAGRIAGELQELRDELRQQMAADLHREFEVLRRDIDKAGRSGAGAGDGVRFGRELERLSESVRELAHRNDDRSVNLLRLELEQLKAQVETLAREESVRAVDRRWEDFDRRWTAFEGRFEAGADHRVVDAGFAVLGQRLEEIARAVDTLPQSLSLGSLEEKLHTLAVAVDQFMTQPSAAPDTLGLIDERLDEISRAIVASTVAAQASSFDPASLERIENRIAALAEQIEEVAQDRPSLEIIERLNMLSRRVDELAAESRLPEDMMERFADQIAIIAERLGQAPAMPDLDHLMEGLEQRFDLFAASLDRRQSDAVEQGNIIFRDLERRLDEVAERLDRREIAPAFDGAEVIEAIDARFDALAREIESREPAGQEAIRGLEVRLAEISRQIDGSAERFGALDQQLIRSLEAQVAGLSAHLAQPGTPLPEFEDISPRLSQIEQSLAGTRETIVEAAREAAERAVQSMGGTGGIEQVAVAGLAQDLKTLEGLTRRSDDRNARTFEAIHDTLLKIVERLGSLEAPGAEADMAARPGAKIAVTGAPSLDMEAPAALAAEGETFLVDAMDGEMQIRTPAQAASEAAKAALGETAGQESARKTSLLGNLTRAFRKDAAAARPAEPVAVAEPAEIGLDEPLEPALINRPLEPGSGAPDLNAILKRVRDERSQSAARPAADTAKSDFIAAARRAAQAAAAEAETLKRQSSLGGQTKGLRIGELFKARRKPILMAVGAVILALAGLQFGKAFLADQQQAARIETAPAVVEQTVTPEQPEREAEAARMVEPVRPEDEMAAAEADMRQQAAAPVPDAVSTPAPVAGTPAEAVPEAQASGTEEVTTDPVSPDPVSPDPVSIDPVSTDTVSTGAVPPVAATPIDVPANLGTPALRDAAASGDAKALFEIGARYAEGRGVQEDMAAAAKWYESAADKGLAPAQYRIGNFYEKGIGVERDTDKARRWYEMAAGQGNASAMHNLAVLLAMGPDGAADNEGAVRWFKAAADFGVKDSQFNLGILAAKGVGMTQNLEDSYKWFALVAKTGDKDAATKRDEIAKVLRPEQLEKARQTAELWQARELDMDANGVTIPDAWLDEPVTTASVDMKKAVQNIQAILNKNGYSAGAVDGVMGGKTKDAIIAFQTDNGLSPTGEVDEKLVEALLARR